MFNKKKIMRGNKFVLGIVVLVAIMAAVLCGRVYYPEFFRVPYSAVFTLSGEFYVGHLFRSPFSSTLRLSEVYILQTVQDPATKEARPQLAPLATESLWQPKVMYFNRKNIVFTGKVSQSSQIGQALQAAALAPAATPSTGSTNSPQGGSGQAQPQVAPTN